MQLNVNLAFIKGVFDLVSINLKYPTYVINFKLKKINFEI